MCPESGRDPGHIERGDTTSGVATPHSQRHTHAMGRERGEQTSPDLFPADRGRDTSRPPPTPPATDKVTEPTWQRHVLPKNLHDALKHLNDEELDLLRAATLDELKRRGRSSPSVEQDLARSSRDQLVSQKRLAPSNKISRGHRADVAEATLTQGKVNAVKAAFRAGITPARIARQFGISQSNVRKALANDEPKP